LQLFMDFVISQDDSRFDDLIVETFKSYPHYYDGASARAFCQFISQNVLPQYEPNPNAPQHDLFRFLVLLLPVDSDVNLNSAAYTVFRRVLEMHPKYGISLLREALQYRPMRHRPFVWRLLAAVVPELLDEDLLLHAEKEQSESPGNNPVLHREVS